MNRYFIIAAICLAIISAILPWAMIYSYGHTLPKVPPQIVDDSIYYYSRMNDIARGFPFVGNPYFFEHRNDVAPAFFGADWVASVPLLLGHSLMTTAIINSLLWTAITVLLLIWLLRRLGLEELWILVGATFFLSVSYWYIQRPVAMQIVFPAFIFFLISYLAWLKNPRGKKSIAALIISSALSFYLYTYLFQIVLVVIGLSHLLLIRKDRKDFLSLIVVDILVPIISLPMILYTYKQVTSPAYWETVTRLGFVQTHTFGSEALINVALVLASMLILFMQRKLNEFDRRIFAFFGFIGLSLIITSLSNVITGKDLETAVHIGRFVEVYFALAGTYSLFLIFSEDSLFADVKSIFKFFCVIFIFGIFILYLSKTVTVFGRISPEILKTNEYEKPLAWLQENADEPSVIFADDNFSEYVPALTKHYVLFGFYGGFHIVPSAEVEKRFLVSRVYSKLTENDIKENFRLYGGVGNSVHQHMTENRRRKICEILRGNNCLTPTDAISYKGEKYFADLFKQYKEDLKNPVAKLKEFNVKYIVKDKVTNKIFAPEKIPGTHLEYQDARFDIYSLK